MPFPGEGGDCSARRAHPAVCSGDSFVYSAGGRCYIPVRAGQLLTGVFIHLHVIRGCHLLSWGCLGGGKVGL